MSDFTMAATIDLPYTEAISRVREVLADAGFGILTEIDLHQTLRAKLDVETSPRVILGACRPQLAHAALQIDPRIAAMLPCNVVVSGESDARSRVDIFDPLVMTSFSDAPELAAVAVEAREHLAGALQALSDSSTDRPNGDPQ